MPNTMIPRIDIGRRVAASRASSTGRWTVAARSGQHTIHHESDEPIRIHAIDDGLDVQPGRHRVEVSLGRDLVENRDPVDRSLKVNEIHDAIEVQPDRHRVDVADERVRERVRGQLGLSRSCWPRLSIRASRSCIRLMRSPPTIEPTTTDVSRPSPGSSESGPNGESAGLCRRAEGRPRHDWKTQERSFWGSGDRPTARWRDRGHSERRHSDRDEVARSRWRGRVPPARRFDPSSGIGMGRRTANEADRSCSPSAMIGILRSEQRLCPREILRGPRGRRRTVSADAGPRRHGWRPRHPWRSRPRRDPRPRSVRPGWSACTAAPASPAARRARPGLPLGGDSPHTLG